MNTHVNHVNSGSEVTNPNKNVQLQILERAVERITGKSADDIRNQTLEARRAEIETARGRSMQFVSRFPFVGRGNVMRHNVINHSNVEQSLDQALRD